MNQDARSIFFTLAILFLYDGWSDYQRWKVEYPKLLEINARTCCCHCNKLASLPLIQNQQQKQTVIMRQSEIGRVAEIMARPRTSCDQEDE